MRRRVKLIKGEESEGRSGDDSDSGNEQRKAKKRPMPNFFDMDLDSMSTKDQMDLLLSLP